MRLRQYLEYIKIKKSRLFDERYYLSTYSDVRSADIDALQHFVVVGYGEGRNPSANFNTDDYLARNPDLGLLGTNPLIHYINNNRVSKRFPLFISIKNNSGKLLHAILFLIKLKGIVFFGGYPYPEREKDGYYQRIRSIDSLFVDRWRIYVDSVKIPGKETWYETPAPKTLVLRPNITGFEKIARVFIVLCILRCGVTYMHSILSVGGIGKNKYFWNYPWINRILDLHGVVPEEFSLQGDQENAEIFNGIEGFAIRKVNWIIVVSQTMQRHIENKYSGQFKGKFITLPIFQGVKGEINQRPYINGKPIIIYSGGLQEWQQVPKMIETIVKTIDYYNYRFYCPDPERIISSLPEQLRNNNSIIVGSKKLSEIMDDYRECHYGFILRKDILVNHVACPTKLIEYLAMGIVPIIDSINIGDFFNLGMKSVSLNDLLNNQLPIEKDRMDLVNENYQVYQKLIDIHDIGIFQLRRAVG